MSFPSSTSPTLGICGPASTLFGHFTARSWTGNGGSVRFGKPTPISIAYVGYSSNVITGSYNGETTTQTSGTANICIGRNATNFQYPTPNGPDGSLPVVPIWIGHNFGIRGYLPGLWCPLGDRPLSHNDNFSVSGGNLNGKSLMGQSIQAFINGNANTENGMIVVETSDTWT
jgi:hypothetical protein